jgi:hypothetical protein
VAILVAVGVVVVVTAANNHAKESQVPRYDPGQSTVSRIPCVRGAVLLCFRHRAALLPRCLIQLIRLFHCGGYQTR